MKRKILINAANLKQGGGIQVASSFINEAKHFPNCSFLVVCSSQLMHFLNNNMKNIDNVRLEVVEDNPLKSLLSLIRYRRRLTALANFFSPERVITVFGPAYWTPKYPHVLGFANGYLINEDSSFIKKYKKSKPFKHRLIRFIHRVLLKVEAKKFWVETEQARINLARYLSVSVSSITVATNNASDSFYSEKFCFNAINPQKKLNILFVSSYYEHKNHQILPGVYNYLKALSIDIKILITLDDNDYNNFTNIKECEGINNLGRLNYIECIEQYKNCDIVLMPSLLETFSAVYPEAMISKTPLIVSDLPFARSLCREAALYFDPEKPEEAGRMIVKLINDPELQKRLVMKGLERLKYFDTPEDRLYKLINN